MKSETNILIYIIFYSSINYNKLILGYEIEHFQGSSGGGGHSSDNIRVDASPPQNSQIANISSTNWDGRRPQSGGMDLPRVPPKQYSDDWDTPNDDEIGRAHV